MNDQDNPPVATAAEAVHLRPAQTADVAELAALGRDSFVAKFGHMYRADDLSGFLEATYAPAAIAAELADPLRLYQLAMRGDRLVGYCKLGLACGFPDHARGARAMELKQLYTAPDAIGGGVGGALMDWAMAELRARGADEVQLSVWSGNHAAQRFYARYGFAKVADTHFWVGSHRDDEFLFACMLE